jgi:hypothetical protein
MDKWPTVVEMHIQNVGGGAFRKVEKCSGCTKTLSNSIAWFLLFFQHDGP